LPFKHHFKEKESDVTIISESKQAIIRAKNVFYQQRSLLEKYITTNREFENSFTPIKAHTDIKIVNCMISAANLCNVGPMAAVAGALADFMLEAMKTKEDPNFEAAKVALVENGGEIAIDSEIPMKIALFAGYNPLNLNLGFLIKKVDCPIGVGTSSATIGHAISFGQADAVTIFARNATLADAAATKIGNLVKGNDIEKSIKKGLDAIDDMDGIYGGFVSRENEVGYTGKIPQLIKIIGDKKKLLKKKFEDFVQGDFEIYK
jgi:hypothetical protein